MRVLIVGCGYLGRRAAQRWLENGDEVIALTRSAKNAEELAGLGIQPILGDVTDAASLARLPAADLLLFAVGFDRGAGHSQAAVYVSGLEQVLHALSDWVRRIVYISSSSVYGQSAGEWVDEASPCVPVKEGGQLCLAAEGVLDRFCAAGPGREGCVLRLSGIYGPGRLLSRVAALRSGTPLPGRPDAFLNLIHVEDAAAAVLAAARHPSPSRLCLVTDDRPLPRRDYYALLAELVSAPPVRFTAEGDEGLNKRCSNRRLREEWKLALQFPTIQEGLPHALAGTVI